MGGALYIEAFTELEEAIKVMKDADIAALNSKVVGLHQEASALNVQMVDKEEVKSAALGYIRSKEPSVPKVVTQSIELVKWGVDVADLMDNPDSIKDLSSAFFSNNEFLANPNQFFDALPVSTIEKFPEDFLENPQDFLKGLADIQTKMVAKANEMEGQAAKITSGWDTLTSFGDSVAASARAFGSAINTGGRGVSDFFYESGQDLSRRLLRRQSHSPTKMLIYRLNKLKRKDPSLGSEIDIHIAKLQPFTEKKPLKDRINALFKSEDFHNLIKEPLAQIDGPMINKVRNFLRSDHASLKDMTTSLEKASNNLSKIADIGLRNTQLETIKDFKLMLETRRGFEVDLKNTRDKLLELPQAFKGNINVISAQGESWYAKIKALDVDIDADKNQKKATLKNIEALEKVAEDLKSENDQEPVPPKLEGLIQLINQEKLKHNKLTEEIIKKQLGQRELMDLLTYCEEKIEDIKKCQEELKVLEEQYKDVKVTIVYFKMNDDIGDKLRKVAESLKSDEHAIGSMKLVLIFEAGVRAGYDLGVAALYAKVGVAVVLSGSLNILDTREIMFSYRMTVRLTMKAQASVGTPEELAAKLESVSIPSPPELLHASAQAKCTLYDTQACHVYYNESVWAAQWSHQITARVVFIYNYRPYSALITPEWLESQLGTIKKIIAQETSAAEIETSSKDPFKETPSEAKARINKAINNDLKVNELAKKSYKSVYFNDKEWVQARAKIGVGGVAKTINTDDLRKFDFKQGQLQQEKEIIVEDTKTAKTAKATEALDQTLDADKGIYGFVKGLFSVEPEQPPPPPDESEKYSSFGTLGEIESKFTVGDKNGQAIYHHFYRMTGSCVPEKHFLEISLEEVSTAGVGSIFKVETVASIQSSKDPERIKKTLQQLSPLVNRSAQDIPYDEKMDKDFIPPVAYKVANMAVEKDQKKFAQELVWRLEQVMSGGGNDILQQTSNALKKADSGIQKTKDQLDKTVGQGKAISQQAQEEVKSKSNQIQKGVGAEVFNGAGGNSLGGALNSVFDGASGVAQTMQDGIDGTSSKLKNVISVVQDHIHVKPSTSTYMRCTLRPRMIDGVIKYEWTPQVFRGYSKLMVGINPPIPDIPIMTGLSVYIEAAGHFKRERAEYEVLGTDTFSYLIMLNKSLKGADRDSPAKDFTIDKYLDLHSHEIDTLLENVTNQSSGAHSELLLSSQIRSSLFVENAATKLGKACFDRFSPGTEEHAFHELLRTDKPKSTLTFRQAAIQLKGMVIELKGMVDQRNMLYEEYKGIDSRYHYLVDGDKCNFVNKFNSLVTNKLLLDDDIRDKELTESLGKRKSPMESIGSNIGSNIDSLKSALKHETKLKDFMDSREPLIIQF